MSTTLLISNRSRYPTGMVLEAFPSEHEFGRLEDKRIFDANNPNGEEWPGLFVLLEIPDMHPLSIEMYDLLKLDDDTGLPTKRLKPQGEGSPYYEALLNDARVSAPWSAVSQLIEDIV